MLNEKDQEILRVLDSSLKSYSLGVDIKYVESYVRFKVASSTLRKYINSLVKRKFVEKLPIEGSPGKVIYRSFSPEKEDQKCYQCSQGWNLGQAHKGMWHCPIKGKEVVNDTGKNCTHFIFNRKKMDQAPHLKRSSVNPSK
jgi:hypothetical protein